MKCSRVSKRCTAVGGLGALSVRGRGIGFLQPHLGPDYVFMLMSTAFVDARLRCCSEQFFAQLEMFRVTGLEAMSTSCSFCHPLGCVWRRTVQIFVAVDCTFAMRRGRHVLLLHTTVAAVHRQPQCCSLCWWLRQVREAGVQCVTGVVTTLMLPRDRLHSREGLSFRGWFCWVSGWCGTRVTRFVRDGVLRADRLS